MSKKNTNEVTVKDEVEFFDKKLAGLKNLVETTEIKTAEDLASLSDTLQGIKNFAKRVTQEMDKTVEPAKEIIKIAKDRFMPYILACTEAEGLLKSKARVYMEAEEAKRLEGENKIKADLESGKIKKTETAVKKLEKLPEKVKTVSTGSSVLSMRKIKDIEITDRNLIPDEYWVVDEAKLKKVALAGVEIPGVKVIEKTSMMSK